MPSRWAANVGVLSMLNQSILVRVALVCLLGVVGFSEKASSQSATLTWTAPTRTVENTPIPATGPEALQKYRIEYGTCSTPPPNPVFGVVAGNQEVNHPALTMTITGLAPGLTCFRAYAINNSNVSSAPSNAASKIVTAAAPQPPGNLTVNVANTNAYKMRQSVGGWTFVKIGTVPAGTECGTQTADGYTVINRDLVAMTSRFDTKPLVVFAQCS